MAYADNELGLVEKGYIITIQHIPTGREVWFKAILTNFSDKYTSNWNSEDVYGRMDPIENFQSTKRVISIGWEVAAADEEEAKINMYNVSELINMTYPVYSGEGASTITSAPLLKMSFVNFMYDVTTAFGGGGNNGLVGRTGGFEFAPDLKDGFIEAGNAVLLPKRFKLSCEFTVFHTHPLGYNTYRNPRTSKFPYGESLQLYKEGKTKSGEKGKKDNSASTATKNINDAQQNKVLQEHAEWRGAGIPAKKK